MTQPLTKEGRRYLRKPFRWTILMAVTFFIAAGRLDIPRAWLAFGTHFLGAIAGGLIMWRLAPTLANQRASIRQGTKKWDKLILLIYFVLLLLVIPMVAGLDVGRYHWSQLGTLSALAGIALYVLFFALFHWAMVTNSHFEGSSRIQADRGHRVVTNGPYGIVRHPGYVAMIFASLADPLIIGSVFALIPGAFAVITTVMRTYLEDRMLRDELAGYAEYAGATRYRLVPGIW